MLGQDRWTVYGLLLMWARKDRADEKGKEPWSDGGYCDLGYYGLRSLAPVALVYGAVSIPRVP